jgi:sec-independent protein translocase protein TatA
MYLPHVMPLAFLNNLMGMDGLIVLVIGLLIFGRRLPEVGKNLGKTIVEFKKGLNGAADKGVANEEPEEPAPAPPRRLAGGSRESTTPARQTRRLPETEEV